MFRRSFSVHLTATREPERFYLRPILDSIAILLHLLQQFCQYLHVSPTKRKWTCKYLFSPLRNSSVIFPRCYLHFSVRLSYAGTIWRIYCAVVQWHSPVKAQLLMAIVFANCCCTWKITGIDVHKENWKTMTTYRLTAIWSLSSTTSWPFQLRFQSYKCASIPFERYASGRHTFYKRPRQYEMPCNGCWCIFSHLWTSSLHCYTLFVLDKWMPCFPQTMPVILSTISLIWLTFFGEVSAADYFVPRFTLKVQSVQFIRKTLWSCCVVDSVSVIQIS